MTFIKQDYSMKLPFSAFTSSSRRVLNRFAQGAMLLACTATLTAQAAEPLKFTWGAPTADYYALYVAIDQDLFKDEGLDPDFHFFPTGAPLLAGLKSGSIDVITTGLATVFALGQGIPLTLIGWETDTAAGEGLVVNNGSSIQDFRDIAKAKAIGAPAGTCAQVALGLLAQKAGVDYKSLNVINVAPPLYANSFRSQALEVGVGWAPYPQVLQEQGYKVVNWDADYTPDGGVCPSLYGGRRDFLKEHPEVGVKLVKVRAKALALIEKNPQLAIDALAKRLSLSPAVAKEVYTRVSYPATPSLEQEVTSGTPWSLVDDQGGLAKKLHIASEILHETGTIPAPLSWDQIQESIDPSYIQRYLKEVK